MPQQEAIQIWFSYNFIPNAYAFNRRLVIFELIDASCFVMAYMALPTRTQLSTADNSETTDCCARVDAVQHWQKTTQRRLLSRSHSRLTRLSNFGGNHVPGVLTRQALPIVFVGTIIKRSLLLH